MAPPKFGAGITTDLGVGVSIVALVAIATSLLCVSGLSPSTARIPELVKKYKYAMLIAKNACVTFNH
jgi:hypothetical protein